MGVRCPNCSIDLATKIDGRVHSEDPSKCNGLPDNIRRTCGRLCCHCAKTIHKLRSEFNTYACVYCKSRPPKAPPAAPAAPSAGNMCADGRPHDFQHVAAENEKKSQSGGLKAMFSGTGVGAKAKNSSDKGQRVILYCKKCASHFTA